MLECFKKINKKATCIFAAGVLFGTAGIKVLSGRDAKKAYTYAMAAALRVKESVLKLVTSVQENVEDIFAEAQQINEERAMQEEERNEAVKGNMEITGDETE